MDAASTAYLFQPHAAASGDEARHGYGHGGYTMMPHAIEAAAATTMNWSGYAGFAKALLAAAQPQTVAAAAPVDGLKLSVEPYQPGTGDLHVSVNNPGSAPVDAVLCGKVRNLVRGLMNSSAAISGLDRPSATSRAIWASWAVRASTGPASRLRTRSPVAASSRSARRENSG